jgi:hypothetical protein
MSAIQTGSTISRPRVPCCLALAIALAIGSALSERPAYGGDLSPKADRLFSEGLDLARVGDCARAREKFAQSYAADPAPGTLINWALCEEKLGRVATALGLLRLADDRLPAGHPKISGVKNEVAALRKRVPYLRMHPLRPLPAGTVVLKDAVQVELSSFDQQQPTDPGAHVIEVQAPGHEVRRYEVVLDEGRTVDLAFEPGSPRGPTPPVSPTEAPRGTEDQQFLGWVIGGAGVAAIGVGTVTGLLALSRWHDVQRSCDVAAKTCPTDEGNEASTAGRSLATVSTISFVAGGVGLLGGAYLLLNFRRPAAPGATSSFVAVSPTGRGIQVSGAF